MATQTADPPPLLVDAARDALDDLERAIADRSVELERRHADLFAAFRSSLEALFVGYSLFPTPQPWTPEEGPPNLSPTWNPLRVRQAGLLVEVTQLFRDLMEQLEQADTELFTDMLQEAAENGYDRGLYQLALAGLTLPDDVDDQEPDDWDPLIRDQDINGMDWSDRLGVWGAVTTDKVGRWTRASMLGGRPLQDTLDGFNRLAVGHTQHVLGLFSNEAYRAFALAGVIAAGIVAQTSGAQLREAWVCRTMPGGALDWKVCPVCAAKHMTVTDELPIRDSHPGCRCIKVQVPDDYVPTPQSFESFQARNR